MADFSQKLGKERIKFDIKLCESINCYLKYIELKMLCQEKFLKVTKNFCSFFYLTKLISGVILCNHERGEKMPITKTGKYSYRFQCNINKKRYGKTFHFYNETKSEIEKAYLEWHIECEKGKYYNTKFTFREFANVWIETYVRPTYSPVVLKNYLCNLNNWILPELGDCRIDCIDSLMLDEFVSKLKTSNTKFKTRKNRPLSNNTIEQVYKIVRTILHLAYTKGVISSNPCDKVKLDLKKDLTHKLHYWSIEEYKKALELLDEDGSLKAFVVEFALKTGLRRSEMFALTWDDIDFENKSISVNKSRQKNNGEMVVLPCKTASSVRNISVPDSIIKKLYRLKAISRTTYIFEKIDYDSVTAWYRSFVKKNKLPYIRFHDLRHTHATLLLYKGIDIKTISERLGHSNIGTTMNVYTHVMKELDVKASQAIEEI